MAKTDYSTIVFVADTRSKVGAGLTGLAYDTNNLTCYYIRPGASATQINLATQTVTGSHSDGGFVQAASANMPGIYRLDVPDAVVADGVEAAYVMLRGAANMAPATVRIQVAPISADVTGAETAIADTLLKRDWTAVSGEADRSVLNALRFLRNKWSVSGSTLTVTKEDDSTSAWTSALTSSSSAEPIIGSDPA